MTNATPSVAIASGTYASSVEGVAAIADSADVIVYLPLNASGDYVAAANAVDYEIKHITGKQLKNTANQMDGDLLNSATLGVFSSAVDNLKRSTVIAVEVKDADLWNRLDNLRSDNHYGMITGAAEDRGSTIAFPFVTEEFDGIITVIADKNNTNGYTKGTILGYSEITQDDNGNYVIKDANPVNDAIPASITAWNDDTIEVNNATELDRSDFNTEVYTATTNGTIEKVADGEPNDLDDGRINILYLPNSFAFIDMNEIIGQRYATLAVDYTDVDNTAGTALNSDLIRSMQWKNASTGETWDGMELTTIYANARVNLSITSAAAGTLTVTDDSTNATLATYTFTGANQTLSNTFTVADNITFNWNASNEGESTQGNFTFKSENATLLKVTGARVTSGNEVQFTLEVDPSVDTTKLAYDWAVKVNGVEVDQDTVPAGSYAASVTTSSADVNQNDKITIELTNIAVTGMSATATESQINEALENTTTLYVAKLPAGTYNVPTGKTLNATGTITANAVINAGAGATVDMTGATVDPGAKITIDKAATSVTLPNGVVLDGNGLTADCTLTITANSNTGIDVVIPRNGTVTIADSQALTLGATDTLKLEAGAKLVGGTSSTVVVATAGQITGITNLYAGVSASAAVQETAAVGTYTWQASGITASSDGTGWFRSAP